MSCGVLLSGAMLCVVLRCKAMGITVALTVLKEGERPGASGLGPPGACTSEGLLILRCIALLCGLLSCSVLSCGVTFWCCHGLRVILIGLKDRERPGVTVATPGRLILSPGYSFIMPSTVVLCALL